MNNLSLRCAAQPTTIAHSSDSLPWCFLLVCLAVFFLPLGTAGAATLLEKVEYSVLPGNQVSIELQLSGSVAQPQAFITENPARIVLDLAGVQSGLADKTVPIGVGPVQSLVAVEASDRTRVVVNLDSSSPYRVSASGNKVNIAVNAPGTPTASPSPAPSPAAARLGAVASAPTGSSIKSIDFKRGSGGEGRVLIRLPSPDTRVSVSEQGKQVIAEISDASLPSRLLRRLDVTDFATPVVAVESRPDGRDVNVNIETSSEYEYLAYQADELFTLEFRPLSSAEKQAQQKKKDVYSGDRLSLNFQDIQVRAVLQLLADFTGLNLVASDTVAGNITLRLKNVPWDQALDIILKAKGLSMRQTGNVVMVAPTQEIVQQEEAELLANQKVEELAPLRSEFIQVNYARASELMALIKSDANKLLTDRGNISFDERTNTLLVQDTAARLEDIRAIVQRLDIPVRQVMIESRVVIANNDFARDLGVRFGFSNWEGNQGSGEFNEVTGGLPGHINDLATVGPDWPGLIQNPSENIPLMVNLPVASPSGAANFLLGKVGSYLLQLELSAMQREGRGEIISSPRVITSDNQKATIKVGQEIPYQTVSNAGTNVEFKEAVLKLDVTPQITPDDRVIMGLEVNKDAPDFSRQLSGGVPLDTRSVKTNVLVDNGETVVLGGVYERTKEFNKEQVPWLGDIPVVGNLFKRTTRRDNNTELLIFVTPKILKEAMAGR